MYSTAACSKLYVIIVANDGGRVPRKNQEQESLGSCCGTVGSAAAFETRGPGIESSHRLILKEHLFYVNCSIKKTKIKEKDARYGPLKKFRTKV